MSILLLRLLPYALGLAALSGVIFGIHHDGYLGGKHEVQQKWDKEKTIQTEANLKMVLANQKIITELGVQHAKNQSTIDSLHADVKRLRIILPKATCPAVREITAASGVSNSYAGDGSLSTTSQAAFDRFTTGLADDALEADNVVEKCRVIMEWAKSQK